MPLKKDGELLKQASQDMHFAGCIVLKEAERDVCCPYGVPQGMKSAMQSK